MRGVVVVGLLIIIETEFREREDVVVVVVIRFLGTKKECMNCSIWGSELDPVRSTFWEF